MWAGTWELDGNTGLTASMAEMLVQSHGDVIRILPALPDEWRNGYVKGICLRGGQKADIYWRDGIPEKVVLVCGKDEKRLLCYGDQKQEIDLKTGERKEYSWKSGKSKLFRQVCADSRKTQRKQLSGPPHGGFLGPDVTRERGLFA